jgi:hypothetical protein
MAADDIQSHGPERARHLGDGFSGVDLVDGLSTTLACGVLRSPETHSACLARSLPSPVRARISVRSNFVVR